MNVVTDDAGRYRANALQPGVYEVTATLGGFQTATFGNLEVPVGQTLAVDMKMRAAGITETVTVTGESPLIDTRRTDVSNVVGETAISNLPINGRRWENFVLLGPGVTNDGNFGLVSYRGISGLYNNNTVDGADNNQAFFSEARGRTRTSYSISQASIKEFQVGVSNFSAEFGRAAGGTVNAVTKSGTNAMRGEGFYFLRDDKFTAKDPFFPAGVDRPNERRQQFGVSAGGPIKTDKVFFFANYDQQIRDFPYFVRPSQNTFITGACTAPGCGSTLAFYNGLSVFNPREGNNKIVLGKVDYAFSNKNTFTAQYNMHRWDSPNGVQTQPVISVSPSANGKDIVKTDFGLFTMNSVVSDRWLNEARVQIGRDFEAQQPNTANGPGTTVTGGIDIGIPNFLPRPKYPDERRYQFIDNVTWYHGAHSFKTGFDINYVNERPDQPLPGRGHLRVSKHQCHRLRLPDWCRRLHATGERHELRPASLHQLQPAVRPARRRFCRRRSVPDDRLQLVHPGQLARQQSAHAEPWRSLGVPEVPAADRNRDERGRVHRQPGVSGNRHVPSGQEQLRSAAGLYLRHHGRAHDRHSRRMGPLLRSFQQQRDLERADEQRQNLRDLQLYESDNNRRCTAVPGRVHGSADGCWQTLDPVSVAVDSSVRRSTWRS